MNIKIIVKVMNFHALLHVETARKKAKKYFSLEQEISEMIDLILNNRNFILDKHTFQVDPAKPALNIYIGSDYGFCGRINFQLNENMLADNKSEKIIIGRKLTNTGSNILLNMKREEFETNYACIEEQLERSIREMRHSAINIIYNHYHNVCNISLREKQIFPSAFDKKRENKYTEDFVVEGKADHLLTNLVLFYLNCEVKIAAINSFASENIMRQSTTTESLKKIEEWQEEEQRMQLKAGKQKVLKQALERYIKKKGYEEKCR
jgi:F0F1-type ATP synthase gamma subunit